MFLRDTPRGQQACADQDDSAEHQYEIMGEVLGIEISPRNTPNICKLIQTIRTTSVNITNELKWTYFRPRPFDELNEPTPIPEKEIGYTGTTSYPSGHTSFSWSVALALSEVAPAYRDEILRRGYDFGDNREIVGFHWASDIEAGRVLGSIIIAHLQTRKTFRDQITLSQMDYRIATK